MQVLGLTDCRQPAHTNDTHCDIHLTSMRLAYHMAGHFLAQGHPGQTLPVGARPQEALIIAKCDCTQLAARR